LKHKLEYLPVSKLTAYETNSRTHSDEQINQIAASINEFGFTNPVLIDPDNTIIAGHGRVQAAKQIGMDEVPCLRLSHLTEAQRKAYVIADNKLALNAGWDDELLRQEIAELNDCDFDLALLGFSENELQAMLLDVDEVEMPDLPNGDKEPFQQMNFVVHDDQAEQIKIALEISKKMGAFDSENTNANGNALARICESFITYSE